MQQTNKPQAQPGPVRTVTRHEIVPGVYGAVVVNAVSSTDDRVSLSLDSGIVLNHGKAVMTADELTDAIQTLTAIRDAMQADATA